MIQLDAHLRTSSIEERELMRQLRLTRLLLEEMGGSLPREQMIAQHLTTVLDVTCGAGGWALDIAQVSPFLHVTGIDSSEAHMTYAQRLAKEGGLINARFLTQDMRTLATGPFEPNTFDLIHVAFIAAELLTTDYPTLMHSLFWLCRPGGMLRWTEMELPLTTSPAFEHLMALVCQTLDAAGQTFVSSALLESNAIFTAWRRERGMTVTSPARRHLGITPMMGSWLRRAGWRNVTLVPVSIGVSMGTRAHPCFVRQVEIFGQHIAPFLCQHGVIASEELASLLRRVQEEIVQEDFCGLCLLLTVSGTTPV